MEASALNVEALRARRLQEERDYYLSDEGFLDYVRDCGAAPDAEFEPHGRRCQDLITWEGKPDPENSELTIYTWKMALWPRGSFKSQVFNVGQVTRLIAQNPDIRILVCSETARQARKFVALAMEIIDSEWYRERFGVHKGKNWKIGSGSFTSAQRTKAARHLKEPTLQATGVGEVQTGAHWDFVIWDDVCSQENTRTPESIESLWYWAGETLAQLDPGCKLFVIGTLHHYADIYCKIIDDPEMKAMFDISVHSWQNEDATLFFPTRLTKEFIARQKAFLPPRLFACFYENRPSGDEEQLFRPEYFHTIPDEEIPSQVWTYILTDFALISDDRKKKDRHDRSAFWVVSLDTNRVAYVRDFVCGRFKPSDGVRIVCKLWEDYQHLNMKAITMEETKYKEAFSSLFEEVRRQTFIHPRMILIGGRSQEVKDMRIEASEPRWRRGDIYFAYSLRESARKWRPLFKEMTEWPFSAHDDIPDAQSDIDKRDSNGRYLLSGPPPGWRATEVSRFQPSMVDGRFNPDYGYPAREMQKAGQGDHDLWKPQHAEAGPLSGARRRSDDGIWTRR